MSLIEPTQNIRTSSTNKISVSWKLPLVHTPLRPPEILTNNKALLKPSVIKRKRSGAKGHPYIMAQDGLKNEDASLFTRIEKET